MIVVFDGFDLPAKKDTKKKREEKRKRYIKKRNLAESEGRQLDYIKFKNYSMTIEKKHIVLLMDYLTFAGVEYVVSPYEADAQLAYMHKIGQIDYVVTEDSDLVLYHCENIVNKLNQSGYCELLQIKNNELLYNNSDTEEVEDFVRLTQEQKIWMALMVGCDYLEKVRGVGLKKGVDLIQNISSLKALFQRLRERCKRFDDSKKYRTAFKNCELVFKFQRVYNPFTKELCFYQQPDEHMLRYMRDVANLSHYVGSDISNLQAHVKGDNIRSQVSKGERLHFDFGKLEYKVDHRKWDYTMNPISNLVSSEAPAQTMSKDDFELCLQSSDRFYKGSLGVCESGLGREDSSHRSGTRKGERGLRRSRSNDLPSPDSKGVSIESLKKGYWAKPRRQRSGAKKASAAQIAAKKKVREIIQKESLLTTEAIMQDILEATLTKAEAKLTKSNRSTRASARGAGQAPQSRKKKFGRPQSKFRKAPAKYGASEKRLGSQIIKMGDLLEAEDQRQRDFSVNISYHTLRLKNDEEVPVPPESKAIYSRDRSLRKRLQKKSRISKYSQNPGDSGRADLGLDPLELSLSQEEAPAALGKRGRRPAQKAERRGVHSKRVKAE